MGTHTPVSWLREIDAGTDNACLVVCIAGDPGGFPVYSEPAAPELLEALQRLVVQMNNLLMVCDVPERFAADFNDGQRQAEAAIAAALSSEGGEKQ